MDDGLYLENLLFSGTYCLQKKTTFFQSSKLIFLVVILSKNLEPYLMRFPNLVSLGFFSKHGGENAEMRCVCWANRMVQSHGASSGTYKKYIYISIYLFISHLFTINARSRAISHWYTELLFQPFCSTVHSSFLLTHVEVWMLKEQYQLCAGIIIRRKKGSVEAWNENRSQTCCVSTLRHNCSNMQDNAKYMTTNTI